MFGIFQQALTRIEVDAQAATLQRCLQDPDLIKQWLWPQSLAEDCPKPLTLGSEFAVTVGPIYLFHRVDYLTPERMRLLLWGPLDGFCEWAWGNGWVQLQVEAISYLPLKLGQLQTLRQLQAFAQEQEQS